MILGVTINEAEILEVAENTVDIIFNTVPTLTALAGWERYSAREICIKAFVSEANALWYWGME